jgi:hypothetical protein
MLRIEICVKSLNQDPQSDGIPYFRTAYFVLIFLVSWGGWDWVHLVRRPLTGLLYQPRLIDDECGAVGVMRIGRGNRSTTNPTWPDPGRRGGKPATNLLRYGTARPMLRTYWRLEFEVLTTVVTKSAIFWGMTPWSPLKVIRHFGGTCRPENGGDMVLLNVGWLLADYTAL